jgi:hypothetical protein
MIRTCWAGLQQAQQQMYVRSTTAMLIEAPCSAMQLKKDTTTAAAAAAVRVQEAHHVSEGQCTRIDPMSHTCWAGLQQQQQ